MASADIRLGPHARRIENLLAWVTKAKHGPALNLATTYEKLLREDLGGIREAAKGAGKKDGRDVEAAGRRAEDAALTTAEQFRIAGGDRQHLIDAVRDAVLAVQVWDLAPDLAQRLYDPLGAYLKEKDLGL